MSDKIKKQQPQNQEKEKSNESIFAKSDSFLQDNQKKLSYVVGGVVIIILAFFSYNNFVHKPKEKQAYEQMYRAEYYFSIDSLNKAVNGDGVSFLGFNNVIDDYGRNAATGLANYYVGLVYMKEKQYDDAIYHLKKYRGKDEIISAMANGAIGDAYVELGDLDKAIKYYLRAANKRPNSFVTPIFLQKSAWVYEQQEEYEKAIKLYKRIQKEYFRSFESREADKNIAYLEAKLNLE